MSRESRAMYTRHISYDAMFPRGRRIANVHRKRSRRCNSSHDRTVTTCSTTAPAKSFCQLCEARATGLSPAFACLSNAFLLAWCFDRKQVDHGWRQLAPRAPCCFWSSRRAPLPSGNSVQSLRQCQICFLRHIWRYGDYGVRQGPSWSVLVCHWSVGQRRPDRSRQPAAALYYDAARVSL